MKKVLLVTNIPNPYRVPLFNILSEKMTRENMHLKVIFSSWSYNRRKFSLDKSELKFDYQVLNSDITQSSTDPENTLFHYNGLSKVIDSEKPDCIIASGFSPATMRIWFRNLFKKSIPYIIWTGSVTRKGRKDSVLRKIQRKFLVNGASSFVVYGSMSRKYLLNLNIPSEKIFTAINTVDTDFFMEETMNQKNKNTNPGVPHFLYLGYLVPRKNITALLEAVKILSLKRKDFHLDIVGDGESSTALANYIKKENLQDLITMHGFKQKHEIPGFFAASTALMFQTGFDIWGLVLNEAMAAGLPCIASDKSGAAEDLIIHGENGYIVDYHQPATVAGLMENFLNNRELSGAMGKKASEFIHKNVNLQTSADGFISALKYTFNVRKK